MENTLSTIKTNQLLLSTASPKPGVSTTLSTRLTPPSFSNTFVASTYGRNKMVILNRGYN